MGGDEEGAVQLEAEKDDGLENCAPSLRYAIRQLIRRVSSSKEGVFTLQELERQEIEDVRFMMEVNVMGTFHLIKAALPAMKRRTKKTGLAASIAMMSTQAGQNGSRKDMERLDNLSSRHPEFRYKTEFQSHEPEFDYLKSLEIEEKINKIRWCQMANGVLFLLSTNDKTIKSWKGDLTLYMLLYMEGPGGARCTLLSTHIMKAGG